MEIKVRLNEKHIGLLEKASLVLFGIFFTSFIFALTTRFLGENGVYLGLLIAGVLIFCGFYYVDKKTRLRIITWSMTGTIIFFLVAFVFALKFISSSIGTL